MCFAARRLESEAGRLRDMVVELTVQCEQTRTLEESNARYVARLFELEPVAASVPKLLDAMKQLREQLVSQQVTASEQLAILAAREDDIKHLRDERSAWQQDRVRFSLQLQEAEARAEAAEATGEWKPSSEETARKAEEHR